MTTIMKNPETGRYLREGKWQIMIHGESYDVGRTDRDALSATVASHHVNEGGHATSPS
jgi:hypothetical protein